MANGAAFKFDGAMKIPGWTLLALYLALLLAWGGAPDARGHVVAAAGIVIAACVGVAALGWRAVLTFLAITVPVTLTIENVGVATGLPFGRYHFAADQFTLWIGRVPLLVPMLYFGVGLLCWLIADVLVGRHRLLLHPLAAAGLMVLWDAGMDPGFSTIGHVWVWHEGGVFFGVPLLNFLGWFMTTWIMFRLFALALWWKPAWVREPGDRRDLRLAAILLYMGIGLTQVVPFLTRADVAVTDAAGTVWHTHAILGAGMLVGFGMVLAGVAALARISRPC